MEKGMMELSKYEKYMLDEIKCKGLRCPKCNEKEVRYIPYRMENRFDAIYPRTILRCNRYYCFNCKASSEDTEFLDEYTDIVKKSEECVKELCKELKLSDDVRAKSIEILRDYDKKWGNRNVVGASVYISSILCGERRAQREVGKILNVSNSAIRSNYKKIAKEIDIDIVGEI